MAWKLTDEDMRKLSKAPIPLQDFVVQAAKDCPVPFTVHECCRSMATQRRYVKKKVSWTYNSRHLNCHAVDLVPVVRGVPVWNWPLIFQMEPHLKKAAKKVGTPIEWGGDWRRTKDGPHWQLPWKLFPRKDRNFETRKILGLYDTGRPVDAPETEATRLRESNTIRAGAVATAGGVVDVIKEAHAYADGGDYFGLVVGVVIICAGLIAMYRRWADAGRPALREIFS